MRSSRMRIYSRKEFLRTASLGVGLGSAASMGGTSQSASEPSPLGSIREAPRSTPVAHECDVCVVGGSSTGVFAAVAAARLGARAAIIEANGFFGGVATASFVNVWHSLKNTEGNRQIIAGLTIEVIDRLKQRDAVIERGDLSVGCYLNTEELKIELDRLIVETKVRPFLHTLFVAPHVVDGRVDAVIIEDKTGRRAIRARYFIDATGDGDLVARMGLETYRHESIQPPTMCCILRGTKAIAKAHPGFNLHQVIFDTQYAKALRKGFSWGGPVPGSVDDYMLAGTRVFGADCSDADQLTAAAIEGRRQVRAVCDILKDFFSEAKTVPLVSLPAKIGIRDSRHVRCLYQMQESEVLEGKRFDDAIANGSYRVDIHLANDEGIIFRYLDGREDLASAHGGGKRGRWRPETAEDPTFYQVPYRSIVPRGASNVLIAGRMIDADPGAFGAVRVMVNCNQMGQAAGTAAYLALTTGKSVAEVDAKDLRETLRRGGALII